MAHLDLVGLSFVPILRFLYYIFSNSVSPSVTIISPFYSTFVAVCTLLPSVGDVFWVMDSVLHFKCLEI